MSQAKDLDAQQVRALATRPGFTHYVGETNRIGVLAFITFVEYRCFRPGTPANEELQIVIMKWPDDAPMHWAVLSFPSAKRQTVDAQLSPLGLRIANGVPHLLDARGTSRFPYFDTTDCFTLENVPGHFAYRNDPVLGKTARDFEREAVMREISEFEAQEQTAGGVR